MSARMAKLLVLQKAISILRGKTQHLKQPLDEAYYPELENGALLQKSEISKYQMLV